MVPQTGLDLIDKTNQVVYLGAGEVSGHHQRPRHKRNVAYKVQRAHLLWYNETKALRRPHLNLSQRPHLHLRWRRLGEEGHILHGDMHGN